MKEVAIVTLIGCSTFLLMNKYSTYYHKNKDHQLPFSDKKDDIKVIINGHRYNLS